MKNESKGIYDVNTIAFFIMLCVATLVLLIVKKTFIENATVAFEILAERGEMGVFHAINALQYLTIPVVYLWKFVIIAFIIWVGCFMYGYRITYAQVWKVVLISESVFLIPEFLKICWFMFIETDPNIFMIREFYPLSLINLADTSELSDQYFYPLKALNVFEVAYWFVLVEGIHTMASKKKSIAYNIIFSSYVLFFFLWLGFYILVYK
ncbi:hypothetical protein [Fulvivirga lutea]|uniref:Uncharacterized protein n=1 Tax=Fulvivirga lutea TaxID=2810512 RepID=A0A975A1L1_9BACT|nr:hypothetical protein [Fulvivirga lutea]QSE98436.1 hypothetical protein JR347_04995 [Fulvivirga lutea]